MTNWKNDRAEMEMRAASEKIMKEAREAAETSKPKPLPMGTKVKYDYSGVLGSIEEGTDIICVSGEGEIVGISTELVVVNFIYIIKTDGIISDVYPYTTFVCPEIYLEVI